MPPHNYKTVENENSKMIPLFATVYYKVMFFCQHIGEKNIIKPLSKHIKSCMLEIGLQYRDSMLAF